MIHLGQLIEKLRATLPLVRKAKDSCGHERRNQNGSWSPVLPEDLWWQPNTVDDYFPKRITFWSNTRLLWHIMSFLKGEICCLVLGSPRKQGLGQGFEYKRLICEGVPGSNGREVGEWLREGGTTNASGVNQQVTAPGDWVSILLDLWKVVQRCFRVVSHPLSLCPTQKLGSCSIYPRTLIHHWSRDTARG